MATVYLCLGSNKGNKRENLKNAIKLLKQFCKIKKISSIYKTSPVGREKQPYFYNCCLKLNTNLKPSELLKKIKKIEFLLGRKNKSEFQRTIDIDILFYNNLIVKKKNLIIPHKELHNRKFVLYPLSEIDRNIIHPILKTSIFIIRNKLKDKKQKVAKYGKLIIK